MKTEKIALYSEGMKIVAALDYPEGKDRFKFIIASHGLYSAKDSEKWQAIGVSLTSAGYALLRLDFRGCGASEGRIEDTTVSGRLKDLSAALYYSKNHPAFVPPVGLVGSSLGGFISMVAASRGDCIGALAALATPATISAAGEVERSLREKGYHQYPEFSLKKGFWEDARRYTLTHVATRISCPTLIIHGEEDEQVLVENARLLFKNLKAQKGMELVPGGDHTFSNPVHREKIINLVTAWFLRYI